MTNELLPVQSRDRIASLDLLRGFAVLGILIMNIQSFSMPGAAYTNPSAYGELEGVNKWIWIVSHIFADQKFMTIFSILFGAGILLMTEKAMSSKRKPAGLHYRRNFWLLIIGLLHAHLIWYGDILVIYAVCGFIVYLFRRLKPSTLLIVGTLLILVHTLLYWLFGMSLQNWPAESYFAAKSGWIPSEAIIAKEIEAVTGSLSEQISHNSSTAVFMETFVFMMQFLWRAGGLMLIGMALYKLEILQAVRSKGFYMIGFLISWLIGLPIVSYGVFKNFESNWSFEYSMFTGSQYNYIGSLFISFGYICLLMLASKSASGAAIKKRLAAVGQMALTNYITQSLICVFIFYGIGLGLFGEIDRIWQLSIVFMIWLLQIIWSKPWLDRYKFGPLEWLWRTLTYGKKQPMKK